MTYEEAILQLRVDKLYILTSVPHPSETPCKEFDIAIETLEKQVPKKPVVIGGFAVCPRCYEEYGFSYDILVGMKGLKTGKCYCSNCGQAIGLSDWSDEEWRNI